LRLDQDARHRGRSRFRGARRICRKRTSKIFTPSELVAIGAEVERIERESAKARMAANDPNNEEKACAH
jgi:hypothetical protein